MNWTLTKILSSYDKISTSTTSKWKKESNFNKVPGKCPKTYFIINSSTNGYCIGRQGVIGGVEFYKIGQMRTKSRGCAFHFVEIQSVFCPYLQNGLEFIYETWQLWSKFQLNHLDTPTLEIWNICAYVNCSYSLLHIIIRSFWHDMNLKLTLGKPFW